MELSPNVERSGDHDDTTTSDDSSRAVRSSNGGTRSCGDGRVAPMPASIVRAISAIKATVEAVKKSQKNPHGNYLFSSTDDVYAAVARKMGEVGYHIHTFEEKCEVVRVEKDGKTAQWLHAVFSFMHATETDTWSAPNDQRTVYALITGPQSFQSAQSFAEKAYLRSLFKLPSGDMDLDAMPQSEFEEDQIALAGNGKKRKSSAEGKRDGSVKLFNEIRAAIASSVNAEMLRHIRANYADEWAVMPPAWANTLDDDYDVKLSAFEGAAA